MDLVVGKEISTPNAGVKAFWLLWAYTVRTNFRFLVGCFIVLHRRENTSERLEELIVKNMCNYQLF